MMMISIAMTVMVINNDDCENDYDDEHINVADDS